MAELWKEMLKEVNTQEADISILQENITGVKGEEDSPDNLFYSEFSEEDARAFFNIFSGYMELYEQNKEQACNCLEKNLEEQIKAMPQKICPVEILLYSSRIIKKQIRDEKNVFTLLKSIVGKNLGHPSSFKSVEYILSGWEWAPQLCILVEAIGEKNDSELIDFAMKKYEYKADNSENDTRLLLSYINMLLATQNDKYIHYIVDVVTNKKFMDNNDLTNNFDSQLRSNTFLNRNFSELIKQMNEKKLTERMQSVLRSWSKNNQEIQTNCPQPIRYQNAKNSQSRQNDGNITATLDSLQFDSYTRKDLQTCYKLKNDDNERKQACKIIMNKIDSMRPEKERGWAYITLGKLGEFLHDDALEGFLTEQKKVHPDFAFSINIALHSLGKIDDKALFDLILEGKAQDFDCENLAQHCRYKQQLLSVGFVDYISEISNKNLVKENKINDVLKFFYNVLKEYNGKDNNINRSGELVYNVINMLKNFNKQYSEISIYKTILDINECILESSPSKTACILQNLDFVNKNLPKNNPETESLVARIDKILIKGDLPSEPD